MFELNELIESLIESLIEFEITDSLIDSLFVCIMDSLLVVGRFIRMIMWRLLDRWAATSSISLCIVNVVPFPDRTVFGSIIH